MDQDKIRQDQIAAARAVEKAYGPAERYVGSPRVFVTQESLLDFSKAAAFGSLVFVSVDRRDDLADPMKMAVHNDRVIALLKKGVQDFRVDQDYIILTGSPYVNAIIMASLGRRGLKTIRFLRWNNKVSNYQLVTVDLD